VTTLDEAPAAPVLAGAEPFNAAEWLVTRHARATPDRRAITAVDLDGSVTTLSYAELDEAVTSSGPSPMHNSSRSSGRTPAATSAAAKARTAASRSP